jgi:amino acid transporter
MPGTAQKNQFGTFAGVFTPCLLTILGVILFLRANFVVGQAGVLGALLILALAKSITVLTTLSTSAIATNMQVRGGGAYYLISRVLGPEFGGAIGVVLFLAQGMSVPFYVLGFSEALTQIFPSLVPWLPHVALGTAAVLFLVVYTGAGWAIKVQYFIMAVLLLSIALFLGGALLRFSPAQFTSNLLPAYTAVNPDSPARGVFSFWKIFAIYFPAVTGIMAGINMSGDLKDPGRSIPRGTLAAIAAGAAVYAAQIVLAGGAFARVDLVARPYLLLAENALFGAASLVAAGMFAASLSSAIGSYMGAPRVLQAVSRDRILRTLRPFAKGTRKGDEPRRALLLVGLLTIIVILWATLTAGDTALNTVAELITMFFLYTYGMLNLAAFTEAFGGNPSFRPRFRYFHWTTALAGTLACAGAALVIHPAQAAVAFTLLAALVWHIRRQELRVAFGDARRGLLFTSVRAQMIRLAATRETARNWRPTAIVFTGNPESREILTTYALWLEAGRGIVYLANILVAGVEEGVGRREEALGQLREFCEKRQIQALPVVVASPDLRQAMADILQTLGSGPVRPNLAVMGWSGGREHITASSPMLRTARSLGMSLLIIHGGSITARSGQRRVDVWWRGKKNGGLMILLAHLLTRNWEWSRATVRLLREVDSPGAVAETRADLEHLVRESRIEAEAEVVVSNTPFSEVLRQHSCDADCIFLGFEVPEPGDEAAWHKRYSPLLCDGPVTVLVCSTGSEDATA